MNANLQAHEMGRNVDPEIVFLIREALANEYPKGPTKYEYLEPAIIEQEDKLDIDSLFLKMCEDKYLLPIVSVLLKLTNN